MVGFDICEICKKKIIFVVCGLRENMDRAHYRQIVDVFGKFVLCLKSMGRFDHGNETFFYFYYYYYY